MAIINYLGDKFVSTSSTDTLPGFALEGAILYSIPLRVGYIYNNNTWNPIESGIAGLVSGRQSNTIYNMGTQWTGSWNIWNNGDLIGFGFNSNNSTPLNKGHFYNEPSGYIAGWVTGIILENQSNTGAFEDWIDLTAMTTSGDWGDLTAQTTSGDWGSILDPTTPGISIDVKLRQDRTTVSALRFRRLVSGSSNYDSTIEFWITDSGTLLPKFTIQSGQFLPWLSGKNFLGAPELPFSGIHTEKVVAKQIQLLDGAAPGSGTNVLSSLSGQLYWSGQKVGILSGTTEDGVLTYNKDYQNINVESGIKISGQRVELGQARFANSDIPFDVTGILHSTSGKLYWSGKNILVHSGVTDGGLITYHPDYPNANVESGVLVSGDRLFIRNASPTITLDLTAVDLSSFDIKIDNSDKAFKIVSTEGNDVTPFSISQGGSNNTLTINNSRVGVRTNDSISDLDVFRQNIQESLGSGQGIYIRNNSASTSSTNQYSSPMTWLGSFWNPTGLNSVTTEFRAYVSTSSGNEPLGSGSGALVFEGQTGGAGYKELMRLDYHAGLKLSSGRTWNSGIIFTDHRGGLMAASGMRFNTGSNVLQIKTISGNQARYHVGGVLSSQINDDDALAGAVIDLATYTIPANTLSFTGDRIRFSAEGTMYGTTNGPKRLILEVYNQKCIDFDAVARDTYAGWSIDGYLYKTNSSFDVGVKVVFITGHSNLLGGDDSIITNTQAPRLAMMTTTVGSGTCNANGKIHIRGQSGVSCYSLFVDYCPANINGSL